MRILLVEDDAILSQILTEHLTAQHYVVDAVADGVAGFDYAQAVSYDLIVLDVNLPRLDGIRLCQLLRQNRYTVPILLLTAKGGSSDKVMGLDAGADDYVVKPCTVEEISARIRALLRRLNMTGTPVLAYGNISLDPVTCEVTSNGQALSLSPKEYSLLELFLRHPQRIFSSSSILERLWSFEDAPGEETIRSHIKRLRRKLKAAGNEDMIDTVYGMGYRLKLTPSLAQGGPSSLNQTIPENVAPETIGPETIGSETIGSENVARSAAIASWNRFKQPMLDRVALLDQAILALEAGFLSESDRQAAIQAAHKLAGSLALFGFPSGTQLGRKIEQQLQESLPKTAELKALVDELHQVLLSPLHGQAVTVDQQKSSIAAHPHLLVIDDDELVRQQFQTQGQILGMQVTVASNPAEARHYLAVAIPDIVLLDLMFPDTTEDGLTLLAALTDQFPQLPVALFTSHDDFTHRLQGVRQGCDRFISKSTPPEKVLAIIQELLKQKAGSPIQVMAVDDDPTVLNWLNHYLPQWGIQLTTLETADAIWPMLKESTPDLVILDVQMPAVSGIDLCKVLRSDRTLGHLPILFLTACRQPEVIQQIYAAGADDYINKPFTESEIVTRIFNRLQRNHCLQQTG